MVSRLMAYIIKSSFHVENILGPIGVLFLTIDTEHPA